MKEDTYAAVEPRHINYFFFLNDIPERNIHSMGEIQDYLNQFTDWEFDEELKLNFLNYIRKTYRNALISLEKFDLSNLDLDEYKECLNTTDFKKISPDDFIFEKLKYYVFTYGLSKPKVKPDIGAGEKPNKLETSKSSSDIIERLKREAYENERLERLKYEALGKNYYEEKTKEHLEQQKPCIEVIKNDFKNSLIKIKILLPQIDNEIEYEKSKSYLSTYTEKKLLDKLDAKLLFDFNIEEIMKYCNSIENLNEKIIYLSFVIKEERNANSQIWYQIEKQQDEEALKILEAKRSYHRKINSRIIRERGFLEKAKALSNQELNNRNNVQLKDSQNEMKVLKRFKRGELKKKCKKYAIEFELIKGETLTKENIMKICKSIEEEGFEVNQGSVGSVLRDKLGYRKTKY